MLALLPSGRGLKLKPGRVQVGNARVHDVVQTTGEVEQNIRVNGDELWPV